MCIWELWGGGVTANNIYCKLCSFDCKEEEFMIFDLIPLNGISFNVCLFQFNYFYSVECKKTAVYDHDLLKTLTTKTLFRSLQAPVRSN